MHSAVKHAPGTPNSPLRFDLTQLYRGTMLFVRWDTPVPASLSAVSDAYNSGFQLTELIFPLPMTWIIVVCTSSDLLTSRMEHLSPGKWQHFRNIMSCVLSLQRPMGEQDIGIAWLTLWLEFSCKVCPTGRRPTSAELSA